MAPALVAAAGVGSPAIGQVALTESLTSTAVVVRSRDARSALEVAIDELSSRAAEPERERGRLLWQIANGMACYPSNMTAKQWEQVFQQTQFLPPTQGGVINPHDRFFPDAFVWLGDGGQGTSGTSRRAMLTYSFPADGTQWGVSCSGVASMPSTLDAALTAQFGSLDRGREFVRSAIAGWRRYAGVTYTEVADDGSAQDLLTARQTTRGDIRIGGIALGTGGGSFLANNTFPSNLGFTGCSGGDMLINTSYFTSGFFGSTAGNFLYFRNTVAHEHGHGLGMKHSVPCNQTKLMEPQINNLINLLTLDEIRAAGGNYGDRFSGNQNAIFPQDFGNLTTPALRSVIERELAINGTVVNYDSQTFQQHDWFRFTLSSSQTVSITVTPTGSTYQNGVQFSGCTSVDPLVDVNALQAGNLALQLLTSGQTVLQESSAGALGVAETVSTTLNAGTYLVRVWDVGGAPAQNQKVQTYDLEVRVGSSLAPPRAIAGLNKRVRANTTCQFIGNHNSYANEAGATIPTANYAWDLDGNGLFESVNNSQPTQTYLSNGVYPVSLRVTDSLGTSATDTIQVTVFGATTSVSTVTPNTGSIGTTLGITIAGANFKGVTSASQVQVSGAGVSVTGTPSVNPLGTTITGLSLVISPAASGGLRNIIISNSDGAGASGTGIGLFTVLGGETGACCTSGGSCSVTAPASCTSPNVYQGAASACTPNPCPQPTGACCDTQGLCTITIEPNCIGGVFQGVGALCMPNPCPPPLGACCNGSSCEIAAMSACVGAGTQFAGVGTTCNASGNFTSPCCKADFNASSSVTVQDVFDFLTAWFAGDTRADINGSGVTVQDVFDFLTAWFDGCP